MVSLDGRGEGEAHGTRWLLNSLLHEDFTKNAAHVLDELDDLISKVTAKIITLDDTDLRTLKQIRDRLKITPNIDEKRVRATVRKIGHVTLHKKITALHTHARKGQIDLIKKDLETISVDAPDENGHTALWHACENNDRDTAELLLKAGANPDRIIDAQTLLTYVQMRHKKGWKGIRDLLRQYSSQETQEYSKQYKRTKLLTHAFEIGGTGKIHGQKIDFEGYGSNVAAATMAKSVAEIPEMTDISQALQDASHNLYNPQGPNIILTGYSGHSIAVLIWKDLFIVCDRAGDTKSLLVHRFDPGKLTQDVAKLLVGVRNKSEKDYKELMRKTLPQMLGFKKQTDAELAIQKAAKLPWQLVGNCSWAAAEGIIKAFLVVKNPKTADGIFAKWQISQQMTLLEKYLDGPHDKSLVNESLNALWIIKERYPKVFDDTIIKRLEDLETRYKKTLSKNELRRFSIHKALASAIPFRLPLRLLQGILGTLSLIFTSLKGAKEYADLRDEEEVKKISCTKEFQEFAKGVVAIKTLSNAEEAITFLNTIRTNLIELTRTHKIDADLFTALWHQAVIQANDPSLLSPKVVKKLEQLLDKIDALSETLNATDAQLYEQGYALTVLRTIIGSIKLLAGDRGQTR